MIDCLTAIVYDLKARQLAESRGGTNAPGFFISDKVVLV